MGVFGLINHVVSIMNYSFKNVRDWETIVMISGSARGCGQSKTFCLLAFILLVCSLAFHASAATPLSTQLVTTHNPLVPRPVGGNGDSAVLNTTPDGRFVLFFSLADDLTPGGNTAFCTELYLRDCLSNTTTLVSVGLNGIGANNTNIVGGMVSTNGRYVVFASDATNLVSGDTNNVSDVFLRDLQMGTTTLISVATNGGFGNGSSSVPFMTPDGRYVAFVSSASNLVANTTNGAPDVFVRDTQAGTTALASPGAGAGGQTLPGIVVMGSPVLTSDGRYVAFYSTASNLPSSGFDNTNGEIYLCDLTTTNLTWVSSNAVVYAGFSGGASTHPAISDNGRYIAFKYGSTNGPNVSATNLGASYLFQYDAQAVTTTVISTNAYPSVPYSDDVYGPEMTPDGRYVTFVEQTVVSNVPYSSVHLWDRLGAPDTLVSQDMFGGFPTNTISDTPAITPDGSHVAFISSAATLVTNTVAAGSHVYLRNLLTGKTQLVDMDTNGVGSVDVSGTGLSVSTNAQYVGFSSPDGSFVSGDFNHARDVFRRDTVNGTNQMLSLRSLLVNDQSADAHSSIGTSQALTPTGRYLVFASRADDLLTNNLNGNQDIFEADLWTGSNFLVSVGLDGNPAQGGDSYNPVVSADGRYVAFLSAATNLVTTPLTNLTYNLFLRDLQAGTTTLQNVDTNGNVLTNGDCSYPTISQDGRYLSFLCQTSLTGTTPNGYWRDTMGNRTQLFPGASSGVTLSAGSFFMSQDGRYVTYSIFPAGFSTYDMAVWDSTTASVVYTNETVFIDPSPTGQKLLYYLGGGLSAVPVTNWVTHTQLGDILIVNRSFTRGPFIWSADENSMTFISRQTPANAPSGSNSLGSAIVAQSLIYLYDVKNDVLALASSNYSTGGIVASNSDSAVISGDGRLILYRSFDTNITPGITTAPYLYLYDRGVGSNNYVAYAGSNAILGSEAPGTSGNNSVLNPAISGNGSVAAFESTRAGFTPTNLAHQANIFVTSIAPWGTVDSVGDGIPDEWRAYYFGGTGTTTNSQSCATCDADGSGMSNLQDYLAGINPTNAAATLALRVLPGTSSQNLSFQWTAAPGISYAVQYSESLTHPAWTALPGDITMVGFQASFTVPVNPAGGFYRVVVVVN